MTAAVVVLPRIQRLSGIRRAGGLSVDSAVDVGLGWLELRSIGKLVPDGNGFSPGRYFIPLHFR